MNTTATPATAGLVGLKSCALVLALALLVLTAAAVAINHPLHPSDGLRAALIAGAVVSMGMLSALAVASLAQRDRRALQYGLASQGLRLGVPAVAALLLQWLDPSLAAAGLFGCVLGIYLPALLVETVLAVRMIGAPAREVGRG